MNLDSYMLPCINKKYLGIECPGCGIQRALSLLLEGDFLAAFHMYPAIYTILILLGFVGINLFISIKNSLKIKIFLLYLNAAIIFISYIIKMTHIIY